MTLFDGQANSLPHLATIEIVYLTLNTSRASFDETFRNMQIDKKLSSLIIFDSPFRLSELSGLDQVLVRCTSDAQSNEASRMGWLAFINRFLAEFD